MTSSPPASDVPAPDAGNPPPAPKQPAAPAGNGAGGTPDFEKLAYNAARFIEQSGKALSAYLKPFETGEAPRSDMSDTLVAAATCVGKIAEHWMSNPGRLAQAQAGIAIPFVQLWGQTYKRLNGEAAAPVVPLGKDKRFAAPEWSELPVYEFLRQAHAIGSTWADRLVDESTEVDPRTRAKAKFYLRQLTTALSPANFIVTNPELMRQTFSSSGENLVRGAAQLAEDIEAGGGTLRIRQSDASRFEFGVNIAVTPGKVVCRNDLMELIQYAPATPDVLKRPLLIVPPWINKFYILDLNAEKSFIAWAVGQGLTVFVVSWVNPDARHRDKTFEDYMREGIFAALDAMKKATGEGRANAIGYCIGGTLLSAALAYMAETDDNRIASATFFTSQADFSDAGDLQVFTDEEQIRALEKEMEVTGYLDGAKMATAFNMLRPNDLLWSYVVDNYIKGKKPAAFDLLHWNSDSTRLPASNHSFYLRNFYLENRLATGDMTLGGVRLDLGKVTLPSYFLAAKEDHIAPAASVFRGALLFGGPVRYVLAGSGHIAGVVNPPSKSKYQYWTGPRPAGTLAEWSAEAVETPGSWWPDWFAWIEEQAPQRVPARRPGEGRLRALGDAPGDYVRVKS